MPLTVKLRSAAVDKMSEENVIRRDDEMINAENCFEWMFVRRQCVYFLMRMRAFRQSFRFHAAAFNRHAQLCDMSINPTTDTSGSS